MWGLKTRKLKRIYSRPHIQHQNMCIPVLRRVARDTAFEVMLFSPVYVWIEDKKTQTDIFQTTMCTSVLTRVPRDTAFEVMLFVFFVRVQQTWGL